MHFKNRVEKVQNGREEKRRKDSLAINQGLHLERVHCTTRETKTLGWTFEPCRNTVYAQMIRITEENEMIQKTRHLSMEICSSGNG